MEGASAANSTAIIASHMCNTRFLTILCMPHYSQYLVFIATF